MMATAICGLLEEQQGVLYFVNAEHPRPVLYRDERVRYAMPDEFITQKFGMLSGPGPLQINVMSLKAGDILVMGSDGRQDILLNGRPEDEVNEDPDLFLDFVKRGAGRPREIITRLLEVGQLADDISLMSLSYQSRDTPQPYVLPPPGYVHLKQKGKKLLADGDYYGAIDAFEKALAFKDDDPEIYPHMAGIYRRMRRFKEASRMYETLAWLTPADHSGLYIAAFGVRASYSRDARVPLAKGIEFGERYRLRDRTHVPNLLNLAELYRLNGELEKARDLLEEIQSLDPSNVRARRLLNGLFYRGKLRY